MSTRSVALGVVAKFCAAIFLTGAAALLWGLVMGHLDQPGYWVVFIVLAVSGVGLLRLTAWSRILASCTLWLASFSWIAVCTPMPVEHIHSGLEPVFGEPVPVWAYFSSVVLGIAILLLPVWFFSKHRLVFRRKMW